MILVHVTGTVQVSHLFLQRSSRAFRMFADYMIKPSTFAFSKFCAPCCTTCPDAGNPDTITAMNTSIAAFHTPKTSYLLIDTACREALALDISIHLIRGPAVTHVTQAPNIPPASAGKDSPKPQSHCLTSLNRPTAISATHATTTLSAISLSKPPSSKATSPISLKSYSGSRQTRRR